MFHKMLAETGYLKRRKGVVHNDLFSLTAINEEVTKLPTLPALTQLTSSTTTATSSDASSTLRKSRSVSLSYATGYLLGNKLYEDIDNLEPDVDQIFEGNPANPEQGRSLSLPLLSSLVNASNHVASGVQSTAPGNVSAQNLPPTVSNGPTNDHLLPNVYTNSEGLPDSSGSVLTHTPLKRKGRDEVSNHGDQSNGRDRRRSRMSMPSLDLGTTRQEFEPVQRLNYRFNVRAGFKREWQFTLQPQRYSYSGRTVFESIDQTLVQWLTMDSSRSLRPVTVPAVRRKSAGKWGGVVAFHVDGVQLEEGPTDPQILLQARERFRQATKTVLILLKWISSLTEKEEEEGDSTQKAGGKTFTDIASEAFSSDELKNSGLTFDLSVFKANREINISNETKTILTTPSEHRTPEQLQTALYGLQHLKSFAEYPLHMQEKLAQVAWYQEVPPKRVIIRQGHMAENFYFILSGQALVRILERNSRTGEAQLRTATVMRKGTSFGELALLHHSRRTATVVSQDMVQLLTIGRDDFFDIFMGHSGPDLIPDHIKFVSSLEFMRDWPKLLLMDHPECCLLHFFKRGVVVVKDSNETDWLYIVKSGSCQVMKGLRGVTPRLPLEDRSSRGATQRPRLGDTQFFSKVDTGLRKRNIGLGKPYDTNDVISVVRNANDAESDKETAGGPPPEDPPPRVPPIMMTVPPQRVPRNPPPGFSKSRYKQYPRTRNPHFSATTSTLDARLTRSANDMGAAVESAPLRPPSRPHRRLLDRQRDRPLPLDRRRLEQRNLVNDLSLKGQVFVQVELLKPKDVFGLTTIHFDDDSAKSDTVVSLVSNGAECIMLSKKYFMENANEQVKKMFRHQVRHYPSDTALQENLQTKVDWDLYKKLLVNDVMASKKVQQFRQF